MKSRTGKQFIGPGKNSGESLEELKYNILDKLDEWCLQLDEFNQTPLTPKTKVTREAGSVFYEFLTALPKVFRERTSDDETQIESARKTMANLERRFAKAGLNLHGRVAAFPEHHAKVGKKSAESAQPSTTR